MTPELDATLGPAAATESISTPKGGGMVRVEDVPLASRQTARVRVAGEGPIGVVLVHGWACTSRYWQPVLERLAGTHEVTAVAPDLPGSGGTPPLEADEFSFEKCSEVVIAAARGAGVIPQVLVGHSMGGLIAALAASAPECQQLVLESYCPMRPHTAARLERLRRLEREQTAAPWIDDLVRSWFAGSADPAVLEGLLEDARSTPAHVLAVETRCILTGLEDGSARRRCAAAQWIFGEADTNRRVEEVRALAETLGAPLTLLPGVGHVPHLEDTDAFFEVVLDQVHAVGGTKERA